MRFSLALLSMVVVRAIAPSYPLLRAGCLLGILQYHILSVGERGSVAEIEKTKAKEVKAAEAKASSEGSGFNLSEFFKGSREELAKVVWPSRQQLVSESVAVLLMVIASATLIYLVDSLFTWTSQRLF